jgi:hypothetical protein
MPASPSKAGPSQFDAPQFDARQVHPEFGYFAPTVRFRRKFALVLEGIACGILVGAVAMFFATMEREEQALAMLATPMLVTPISSAATSSAATPSSPIASAPAAIASTPAASGPAPAAPAASTPTVSKPGSSTPASATLTPPQTAAVPGFAPVRFVPESIALPAAAPRHPPVLGDTPPAVTVGASASVSASAWVPAQAASAEPTPVPPVAATPAPAPEIKAVVAKPRKRIVREPRSERTARHIPPEPEPRTAFAGRFRRSSEPPPGFWRPHFGFGL